MEGLFMKLVYKATLIILLFGGDVMAENIKTATLGGGCFWCIEAVFDELKGVKQAVSGYAGGHQENPTYQQVTSKTTGHAEVVQVVYDADTLGYEDILKLFFEIHDPTTKDRQGNDVGPQYRSVIFYHNEEQKEIAQKVMEDLKSAFSAPIVTELEPFSIFYKAEGYHQDYYKNNPNQGYCQFVIAPKVDKFRHKYSDQLKN